jgi:predicted esterase
MFRRRFFPLLIALCVVLAGVSASPDPLCQCPNPKQGHGSQYYVTYRSSVDNVQLAFTEFRPQGYTANQPYPLIILLHGSGGNMCQYTASYPFDWREYANTRGYVLVFVQARTLKDYTSSRATFYLNGPQAPGEQDILDLLPVEEARANIDSNRIYLAGFSMGGAGALNLAALHPGTFAASCAGAPISDYFQEDAQSGGSRPTPSYFETLGGAFTYSTAVETRWYQNSPRFTLDNLMHTPVLFVHGEKDTVVPNAIDAANPLKTYAHSHHLVDVSGFVDSRGTISTLQDLAAEWPGGYLEGHNFPANKGHTSEIFDPDECMDFFDAHSLVTHPSTVAFTTYDDQHTTAYWLKMDLAHPNTAVPATVFAALEPANNAVRLQLGGESTLTLDLNEMGLTVNSPMTLKLSPRNSAAPPASTGFVLSGLWPLDRNYRVYRDKSIQPAATFQVTPTGFILAPELVDGAHDILITWGGQPGFETLYLPVIFN